MATAIPDAQRHWDTIFLRNSPQFDRLRVVILDPLYLSMPGDNAANLLLQR